MCTILILNRVAREYPLVIAANRDELFARDASGPRVLAEARGDRPKIVCGIDQKSGGSWFGVNGAGLFVALTNQRTHRPPDPTSRSRGEVVVAALQQRSPKQVRAYLEEIEPGSHNAFNLIYGDGRDLEVAYARPDQRRPRFEPVPVGIHALPNDELDSAAFPKVRRARELLGEVEEVGDLDWAALSDRLTRCLADHHKPPLEAIQDPPAGSMFDTTTLRELQALCIHLPTYGTRSATIAALEPGSVARYLYADGPPCTAAFVDMSALLG